MRVLDEQLTEACERGEFHKVENLLQQGAAPNARNWQGVAALILAARNGHKPIVALLVQHGADPHIPNHQGENPTAIALRRQIPLKKTQPSTIPL